MRVLHTVLRAWVDEGQCKDSESKKWKFYPFLSSRALNDHYLSLLTYLQ